jgi:hypothetical protein
MSKSKFMIWLAALFAAVLGLSLMTPSASAAPATPSVSAAPATAAAANDAIIKNQATSATNLGVCHSLSSETTCSSTAWPPPTLAPGQNTRDKFGWADTDAIWCGQGYTCQINSSYFTGWGTTRATMRLIKVSGCFGCFIYVIVHKN